MISALCCKKSSLINYIKSGHTRGFQRYKYKDCGYQFIKPTCRSVHPALRSFAIVLYAFCGVFRGKIAQLFKVSTVAVLKWIEQLLYLRPSLVASSEVVMGDEM